jgi:hypothetical protein
VVWVATQRTRAQRACGGHVAEGGAGCRVLERLAARPQRGGVALLLAQQLSRVAAQVLSRARVCVCV